MNLTYLFPSQHLTQLADRGEQVLKQKAACQAAFSLSVYLSFK
jgi:hypothetical protein